MLNPTTAPYQQNGAPSFIADLLTREHVLAGGAKINAAAFNSADAVVVVVGAAGAAANASTVPVDALPAALPDGAVLRFGAANSKKFAVLNGAVLAGAASLTTQPIPTALVDNDTAYYDAPGAAKRIVAGTLVGCTFAELEAAPVVTSGVPAGLLWGPAADADDIVYFSVYDIEDAQVKNDVDLLRHGTAIFVNHIPNWATLSATLKGKVRAAYEVAVGATEV